MTPKHFVLIFALTLEAQAGSLFGSDTLSRPSRTVDILHYKIELRFEEEKKKVLGITTISFVPLLSKLDSFQLDAVEMDIKSVLMNGKALAFSNNKKRLVLKLDKSYSFNDTLKIAVDYSCSPVKGLFFTSPDSTNPQRRQQIWTQGEDMNNRFWFPCWDFPNDKATSELIATVKESWVVLSNGKLVDSRTDKKKKTKTFHWIQSKPHASYLVMMVAGEYTILTDKYKNIPVEYYAYVDRIDDTRRSLSATPEILKFMEHTTGFAYPWEKCSQVFIQDFMWGGMENTSAVTLNESYLLDQKGMLDFTADDVVAHELAHQWFGDVVTCRDWTELWLNESFANFYEGLYKKQALGPDEFQFDFLGGASGVIGSERSQGRLPIVSQDSYSANLYSKGAWVLYMLQSIVGEKEFARVVRLYLQRNAFTSVSTHDWKKAVEDATGQNLDLFFEQWVYKAGHPQLTVTSAWDEATKRLTLTVQQTQKLDSLTGVFVLPVDIECTTSNGTTLTTVHLTQKEEKFELPLPEKPLMVIFDKGMKILKTLKFEKSKEEFLFQLAHAKDIGDRMAAAKALKEFPEDTVVFAALKRSALNDSFWSVRREATIYLGVMKSAGVKQAMFEIYKDKKSAVRNAAVVALERFPASDAAVFLKNALAADSSYIVQSSCLHSLVKVDSIAALALAREYAGKESHRNILRRAALSVFRSLHSPEALPYARTYAALGNPPDIRGLALSILREGGEKDKLSRDFVLHLARDGNASIRKGAVRTLGIWGGDDAKTALEERKPVESDPEIKEAIQAAIEEIDGK